MITFRKAQASDLPAIVAMLADDPLGAAREDASLPLARGYLDAFDAIDADPNQLLAVAVDGAEVVGTLRLATKKPWAIDLKYFTRAGRALYLTDMAVDPASQRRGVGRGLLHAAVEVARAWPADAIRLDAYDAAAGAGPFYAACGFREVGRASYRGVPLVYFEKLL